VARHGYAAADRAVHLRSPRDARYHYSKRFGIEVKLSPLFEQAIASPEPGSTTRLLYVVVMSPLTRTSGGTFTTEECGDARRDHGRRQEGGRTGVRQYDSTSCVDGPRFFVGPSPRIGHLTTDSPLTTDRASQSRVATLSRRRLTAAECDIVSPSIRPVILVETVAGTTDFDTELMAAKTASRGIRFVRILTLGRVGRFHRPSQRGMRPVNRPIELCPQPS